MNNVQIPREKFHLLFHMMKAKSGDSPSQDLTRGYET